MFGTREQRRRAGWLLELQEPIYNYVLRMVRDEESAADLTQEVFARALERPPELPRDRLRPWLFGVAAKTVARHFRAGKRRREREQRVAREKPDFEGPVDLESRELEEVVHRELAELPSEQRSLLLLHYFGSLNQTQVAEALGLPRTTVADRLGHALAALKSRLRDRGHFALIPGVEGILRNTVPVPVPAAVTAEIAALAAGAGISTAVVTGGGFLMTKQFLSAALIVFALSLGGGIAIGRSSVDTGPGRIALDELRELEEEQDEWRSERKRLLARSEKLGRQLGLLEAERDQLRSRVDELQAVAEAATAEELPVAAPVPDKYADIDWEGLAEVIQKNMEAFAAMAEGMRRGEGSLTKLAPQHQASFQELMVKWNQVGAQARVEDPYPFLDPELFPTLMDVMLRGPLGLSDAQIEGIAAEGLRGIDEAPLAEDATPLEAFQVRNQVVDGVMKRLRGSLAGDQESDWQSIAPVFEGILRGDHRAAHVGLGDAALARDRVLHEWKRHYSLDGNDRGEVAAICDGYLERGRKILERHGQWGNDARRLSPEEQRRLDGEFFALQRQIEAELLPLLDEGARAELQQQYPVVIRFAGWAGFNGETRVTGGP